MRGAARAPVVIVAVGLIVLSLLSTPALSDEDPTDPPDPAEPLGLLDAHGTFLLGTYGHSTVPGDLDPDAPHVIAVTSHAWDLDAEDCHRRLYADLEWTPTSLSGDPRAPVDAPYVFDITLTHNGTSVTYRIYEPRDLIFLGQLPDPWNITVELALRQGIHVEWTFSVYAHLSLECLDDGPILPEP